MPRSNIDFNATSLRDLHRTMLIINLSMPVAIFVFAGIVHFILLPQGEFGKTTELAEVFKIVATVSFAAALLLVFTWIPRRMARVKEISMRTEKLKAYYQNFIIRLAMIETPALFCCIAYLITADVFFLAGAIGGGLLLIGIRPTKEKILLETGMSIDDF